MGEVPERGAGDGGSRGQKLTRRTVLGTASLAVTGSLAGCTGGPTPHVGLDVHIPEEFDTEQPVTVPLDIDVVAKNVNSNDIGFEGVTVELFDQHFERLASQELGRYTWQDADPENRSKEERDGFLSSTTIYQAEWDVSLAMELPTVPTWITFSVDEARIGDDETDEAGVVPIGTARASSPGPDLGVDMKEYDGPRPAPKTVGNRQYRTRTVAENRPLSDVGGDPFFPESTYPDKDLDRVELSFDQNPIAGGKTTTIVVTAHFEDGQTADVTDEADVRVLDETVVVHEGDELTGRKTGTATVEATYRGAATQAQLDVVTRTIDS